MKTAALQKALYDKLTGDAALMAVLSSKWGFPAVFDHIPQVPDPENNAYFPYVTIQAVDAQQWDTDTSNGADSPVQIDVWSRTRSMLEVRKIADAIYGLLHYTDLIIVDASHAWTSVDGIQTAPDPDNITRRAMVSVRVVYDDI